MSIVAKWVAGRLHIYDGADAALGGKGIDFSVVSSSAYLHGAGNSTTQVAHDTAGNFLSYYLSGSAATGTYRGAYLRLYLTGGAGGEALRAFCTNSSDAPVDTVNGAHISLNFGASAGNITGLGTAMRATLHVPNRSLTGTTAAVQAEIYGDGASAALGGVTSFIRMVADGTPTTIMDDAGYLFDIQGLTSGTGDLFYDNTGTAPANTNASLKIRVGSANYWIMLYDQQAA